MSQNPKKFESKRSLSWWRKLSDGQQRKGLDSLFALLSWQVWKERKARCFRQSTTMIAEMLQIIKMEADRWIEAGAARIWALADR